jgi:hypothetical protein
MSRAKMFKVSRNGDDSRKLDSRSDIQIIVSEEPPEVFARPKAMVRVDNP